MKTTVAINLVAIAVVLSFFVGIAFLLSSVYARMLKENRLPADWIDDGGIKAQLIRGVRQSASGNWKPLVKRIWVVLLLIDLVAVIIVLMA
jgi:hypothetical protein